MTPEKLRKNRRYAILASRCSAALLPTLDPVTMMLEMVPLILLYELSILLASVLRPAGAGGGRSDRLRRGQLAS